MSTEGRDEKTRDEKDRVRLVFWDPPHHFLDLFKKSQFHWEITV